MAVTLTGAGGLFTIIKKAIIALDSILLAQGTTIADDIDDTIGEMADADTVDGQAITATMRTAAASYIGQTSLQAAIRSFVQSLIIDRVTADAPETQATISACLDELIRQMEASSDSVDANAVTVTVSSNPGSDAPTLVVSKVGGDGRDRERIFAETLIGEYATASTLRITAGGAQSNKLAADWPQQSGARTTLALQTTGLLTNPSFDDDDNLTNKPDGWNVEVGVVGTTIALTSSEVQTLTISGTPTSGTWTITYTGASSYEQETEAISYDASASDVQSALAALTGLSAVTVTKSGTLATSVVYTVNFNGTVPAGDQAALATSNTFDTGSIAVAEVTAGGTAYNYRALTFTGTGGAELTELRQPLQGLGLKPSTVYAISLQMLKDSATTGQIEIELVDGAGTVLTDAEGTNNRLSVDVSTLSDSAFTGKTAFFRTPAVLPDVFFLAIRVSTGLTSAKAIYMDECLFAEAKQLYAGGPLAVLFAGDRALQPGDRYEIDATNDRGGSIQTWFWRLFDRQLPSDSSGSETITD